MEWQPISTAPKDGTQILILHEDDMSSARWSTIEELPNGGYWRDCWTCGLMHSPTHWMPMPELPKFTPYP